MQEHVYAYTAQYVKKNKRRSKWIKVIAVLALIVGFCTVYELILPAITLQQDVYCGLEEHTHTDECYEMRLTCGFDETEEEQTGNTSAAQAKAENDEAALADVHVHGESCYENQSILSCGTEESTGHIHDESCMSVENKLVCGLEEGESSHIHTEDCYKTESVLVCDIPEESLVNDEPETIAEQSVENNTKHVHTEACYEKVLICEKAEHQHNQNCYSNKNADLENESDWELSVSRVELSGKWSDDLISIAKTQIGNSESSENYIVDEKGNKKGITRYGQWYGDAYGDWCAMFVSFCLNYAEIDKEYFPYESGCDNWIKKLSGKIKGYDFNLYHAIEEVEAGTYEIKPGDLIFFNWDNEPDADHVGIVKEIETDENGKQISITTIEGNAGNTVKEKTYEIDNENIMGYGELPENPDADGADAEESQVIIADAEKQESKTFTAECEEYVVTATYAEGVQIPAGAVLTAELVTDEDTLNSVDDYLESSCQYKDKTILQLRMMVGDKPYHAAKPVNVDIAVNSNMVKTEDDNSEVIGSNLMIVQMITDEFESLPLQVSEEDGMIHCQYTQETLSNVALVYGVDSKHILTFEGEDYSIIATYTESAGFPDNVELSVTEILGEELQKKCDELTNMEETGDIQYARLFDITFLEDGVEREPAVPVQIQIVRKDLIDLTENMEPGIVHFGEEENEILDVELITEEDGTATFAFEGETFSVYASYISDPFEETATSTHPATIATVDTKSLGITLNMFDYWGSVENHIGVSDNNTDTIDKNWTNGSGDFVFTGINARHTNGTSLEYRLQNYLYFSTSGCSFSGDNEALKNLSTCINAFTGANDGSGGKARQGIVNNTLTDGYPTLATSGESLSYLFKPNNGQNNKRDYLNLNHLFKDIGNGYISYCSDDNYARLDTTTGNFKVYSETFENADSKADKKSMIGFFPFNDYNSTKTEVKNPSDTTNYYNHHFGLTMTANFVIPEGKTVNGEDEIFYFSGDDDMWLFIDGVLVLDIGGIHEPCAGEINFTKGTVTTGNKYNNAGVVSASPGAATTIGANSTLETIFKNAGKTWDGSEESEHVMQIFYMERGGCYSNLTLTMNIPFFTELPIAVTKDTEGVAKTDDADTEFTFQIMVETAKGSNTYEPYTGSLNVTGGSSNRTTYADSNGYFKIKAGETATTVDYFKSTRKYYVSEIGVDGTRYETVKINGTDAALPTNIDELIENGDVTVIYDEKTSRFKISQLPTSLYKLNNTNITNVIREEKTNLTVKKEWYDGNENHSYDTVKFKIYQKDVNNPTAEKRLYTYKGQTEFELSVSDNWQRTFTDLPKKTLDHEYEYSVEEIDVKDGYTVSYNDPESEEDGNTSITIMNGPQVNITVQKKWYRSDGVTEIDGKTVGSDGIQVQLYRSYIGPERIKSAHTITFKIGSDTIETREVRDGGLVSFKSTYNYNGNNGDYISSVAVEGQAGNPTVSNLIYTISDIRSDITVTINVRYSGWTNWAKSAFSVTSISDPEKIPGELVKEAVGNPVTLNKSNNWSYCWGKLETPFSSSDGTTYTYYVEEIGTFNTYTVSYVNNSITEDAEDGTIIVKNTLIEYELPETGGSGTKAFTIGGILMIAAAFVIYLLTGNRRRHERRYG